MTGIAGISVHPSPRPRLVELYTQTLEQLNKLPSHSVYRQSVQAITEYRKKLVEETTDERQLEQLLGVPRIELALQEAHDEIKLIDSMAEWKAWEELEVPIPEGQWEGFQAKIKE